MCWRLCVLICGGAYCFKCVREALFGVNNPILLIFDGNVFDFVLSEGRRLVVRLLCSLIHFV